MNALPIRARSAAARLLLALGLAALGASALPTQHAHAQQGRQDRRDITLTLGEQRTVPAAGVRTYSPAGVAVDVREDFQATPPRFIIVGSRAGTATVLFTMQDGSELLYRVTVTDGSAVAPPTLEADNIRLDLYFVQLNDTYNHDIGLAWPAFYLGAAQARFQATIPITNIAATNAQFNVTNQPLPRLDLLQQNGWARIMRQAALITANGQEASFRGGGEINVQISGALSGTIQQIKFGSEFTVTPRYDRQTGRVELAIEAQLSDLTDDRGTGIPGRTVSNITTHVNLEMGQAIVLGGLVAESESQQQGGLPGLSQIPILGVLFGTHTARAERTRSVIFIVPTVVDSVNNDARQRIRDALRIFEQFNGGAQRIQLIDPPALPEPSAPAATGN